MQACNRGSKTARLLTSGRSREGCANSCAMNFARFSHDEDIGAALCNTNMKRIILILVLIK